MATLNVELIFYKLYTGTKAVIAWMTNYGYVDPVYFTIAKIGWGVLSLVLSLTMAYLAFKIFNLWQEERETMMNILIDHWHDGRSEQKNQAWEKVINSLNSDNPADWKIAIMDADAMLDTMVVSMGYQGDTFSDRLKSIEPSDFQTLQEAWEAHKVRNAIAHESGFDLTRHEATRVISLYERVFREFEYI